MRTLHPFLVPLACLLAACGPSESEVAEAERSKAAHAAAQALGLAEAPVDLGEGLILTVLQRGSGDFVPAGGRVRVHYDASVVAVAEAPGEEASDAAAPAEAAPAAAEAPAAEVPAAESAPVDGAAPAVEGASEPAAEPAGETPTETAPAAVPEVAPESAPASDAPATDAPQSAEAPQGEAATPPGEGAEASAAPAEPAAPVESAPEATDAAAAQPALPRRFDSSRARGVPDTWDLSRTASPRLIEGLRRGLVGLTAGSRVTLLVPAALAWGDEGLPDANVPPLADVLYEIELIEVLP